MVPKLLKSIAVILLSALLAAGFVGLNPAPNGDIASAQSSDIDSPDALLHDEIPVSISGPTIITLGQPATFFANTGRVTVGYDFIWSFGDGATHSEDDENDVVHAYGTLGIKTITVIVSNGHDTGIASLNVTVVPPPPPPTPEIVAPRGVTIGASLIKIGENHYQVEPNVNFTLIARVEEGAPDEYIWTLPNVAPANGPGNTVVVNHVFGQRGEYTISLTARNSKGSESTSIQVDVLSEQITGLRLRTPTVVNAGQRTRLGVSVDSGTEVGFTFDFGTGTRVGPLYNLSNEPIYYSPEHGYPWIAGTLNEYVVTVKAQNGVTTNPIEIRQCIVVRPAPIVNLRIVSPSYVPSPSDRVDLTVLSDNGAVESYEWTILESDAPFGNAVLSSEQSFSQSFSQPGVYLIQVKAKGYEHKENGCTDASTVRQNSTATSIVVVGNQSSVFNPVPPDPAAVIYVNGKRHTSASNQLFVEIGKKAKFEYGFSVNSIERNLEPFAWDFGGDSLMTGQAVEHTFSTKGTFTLQAISGRGNDARAFYGIINVTGQKTFVPFGLHGLPPGQSRTGPIPTSVAIATATPLLPTATPLPPTATPLPPTVTPIPPTVTPTIFKIPIATSTKTSTPLPYYTATATSTFTGTPVNTLVPTNTPIPTSTPAVPMATITPIPTSTSAP